MPKARGFWRTAAMEKNLERRLLADQNQVAILLPQLEFPAAPDATSPADALHGIPTRRVGVSSSGPWLGENLAN